MTPEQLLKTRAERWRQNGNALVTIEDAEEWLRPLGLCLFVPRRVQLATPAPSFVEACMGQANATPPLAAIENATALLTRMIDKGSVVPLNLLGISGEQPDFLVTTEALPYVFALRGDKDWKHEPQTAGNGRVSPLVLGIWKALERTGVQTAVEIREAMGKELTEAAVLRGLSELWNAMRVIMLPGERGDGATWELLKARYQRQMAAGAAMSQVSALSVLLAQYLQSAVGATSEEAEIFLSPLSSRSKVREVVRGLTATRQLEMIGLDGQAVLYVEGTLPEFETPQSQVTVEAVAAEPDETEVTEVANNTSKAPVAGNRKIRKFIKPAPRSPGEADPLRWKRDRSVPPPAGQSRGTRSDALPPAGQGFDRRSKPESVSGPGPRAKGGAGRSTGGFGNSERPARSFSKPGFKRVSKPGFKPGGEQPPSSRPSAFKPSEPRVFSRGPARGAADDQAKRSGVAGGFSKKPRWVPREGSRGPDRPSPSRPDTDRPQTGRSAAGGPRTSRGSFASGGRPPSSGARPYNKPPDGGFKPRSDRPFSRQPGTGQQSTGQQSTGQQSTGQQSTGQPFSRPGAARGADGRSEKKPRWIPRDGSTSAERPRNGQGRPSQGRPGQRRPSQGRRDDGPDKRPLPSGGSRPFNNAGAGGFKPRSSRSFSPPPSSPSTSAGSASARSSSGGEAKKPRWVPRQGNSTNRPGTGRAASSRAPANNFGERPSFSRKTGFGARPGSRPPSGSVSGAGAEAAPGRRPGGGKPNFGRKPGGRPPFGKKDRERGPGDYPRRKSPGAKPRSPGTKPPSPGTKRPE